MGTTTGFVLRHPMSERGWQVGLMVELVDPVSGALVRRGIGLRALLPGGAEAPAATLALSGRFAFRELPPEVALTLLVTPQGAPFFPERVEVPAGGAPGPRQVRVVLVPHRGYPFAAGERRIHHRLLAGEKPLAGVAVAVEEGAGVLGSPARTDADGEFVLHLRPDGARRPNGGARPAAAEPMPPGLEAPPAGPAAPERRLGLVFTRDGERRLLPAAAGPVLPLRGAVGPADPEDAIRWEDLAPIRAAAGEGEAAGTAAATARPRRGPRG